jgi:hypothetical protein
LQRGERMRVLTLVALMLTACQFSVHGITDGTNPGSSGNGSSGNGDNGSSTPPSPPTASTPPPTDDAGTPPPSGGDMSQQRVGTACTSDAECDPGLFCAKSFLIGLQQVPVPGGYCTLDCSKGAACPANSFCGAFSFGHFCLSSCPPDPCRVGYSCCANSAGANGCTQTNLCKME